VYSGPTGPRLKGFKNHRCLFLDSLPGERVEEDDPVKIEKVHLSFDLDFDVLRVQAAMQAIHWAHAHSSRWVEGQAALGGHG
jgi:hypothetical protein